MISFARNQEDVLLHRALKDVRKGFYVDVGASHPSLDSITQHFYASGWSGINLEPSSSFHLFPSARPRDVNLNVAASEARGRGALFEFDLPGASTFSRERAETHRLKHGGAWREQSVALVPLAEILSEHVRAQVDFLSIDVEGHEFEAVSGNDWNKHRPRIVVVKAARPDSTTPGRDAWEPILVRAGFHFVASNGFKRFYVREEDRFRTEALQTHLNSGDDFTPAAHQARVHALEARIRDLEALKAPTAAAAPPPHRRRGARKVLRSLAKPFEKLARKIRRMVGMN